MSLRNIALEIIPLGKNARFWIWHNDSIVKITLTPGKRLHLHHGGDTDEGYYYSHESYYNDGEYVTREINSTSRDCDGRLDHFSSVTCHVDNLRSDHNDYCDIMMPQWENESRSQRDYSAEAMGY